MLSAALQGKRKLGVGAKKGSSPGRLVGKLAEGCVGWLVGRPIKDGLPGTLSADAARGKGSIP